MPTQAPMSTSATDGAVTIDTLDPHDSGGAHGDTRFCTQVLRRETVSDAESSQGDTTLRGEDKLPALLRSALVRSADDTGWAPLGPGCTALVRPSPGLDACKAGNATPSGLRKATRLCTIVQRLGGPGPREAIDDRVAPAGDRHLASAPWS